MRAQQFTIMECAMLATYGLGASSLTPAIRTSESTIASLEYNGAALSCRLRCGLHNTFLENVHNTAKVVRMVCFTLLESLQKASRKAFAAPIKRVSLP